MPLMSGPSVKTESSATTIRHRLNLSLPEMVLVAMECCHWRYSEKLSILPPSAIQSCRSNGSGLDRQIQRSVDEWRPRSEKQAVRCGLPVIREQRANVNVESWITSAIGELLSCDASNDSQNQFQGQLDIDRVIVETSL
jgi:hypothetical protein